MTVLSDRDIKKYLEEGKIIINNFDINNIDPCSVDLRLGNKFRTFLHTDITHIDVKIGIDPKHMTLIEKTDDQPFIIHPNELVLSTTKEYLKMPPDLVGTLDGRSSLGRLGIVIHSTANSVDPGFEGNITLEISNISRIPVTIWPNMKICRLTFTKLTSESENPYNKRAKSKYNAQKDPEISKISQD